MDATKRKQLLIGGGALGVTLLATATVLWAMQPRVPDFPETPEDAIAAVQSSGFDMLDGDRKMQYYEQLRMLTRQLDGDERRALMEQLSEEERRQMREDIMDELAKRFARGEEMPDMRGSRPPRGDGERRQQWEEMTDEERAEARRERMEQMANEISESFSSGNAQSNGLQQEMRKRGGGFRGGGGGRRGN
ncbi:MAG: hypothetical protein ACYTF7_11615 [Planctomycetota bacterium]|jgi:hypothetical protein